MSATYAEDAIQAVEQGKRAFCKFLSANDTGKTGGHQAGIYISKPSVPIIFDHNGTKGENMDRWVKVTWQDGVERDTRFIYYGTGTRNEYRITNFGRRFPFLRPEYTGALFVLVQMTEEDYEAYVLNTDDEIETFLAACGLSPTETNRLIDTGFVAPEEKERIETEKFLAGLTCDFPSSEDMSAAARRIQDAAYDHRELTRTNPDKKLLDWTDAEFRLFRAIEHDRYGSIIKGGFASVDDFISMANQMLNRRKSRAGKSLEHHLAAIFADNGLQYQEQAVTEGNKRPDFIFPSSEAYHSIHWPTYKLVSLAAKTTCKDRWRQVINEADRLRNRDKFLCTLQQGISAAQMDEMQAEKVVLVVPQAYISTYPKERQDRIWTIARFVDYIKEVEGIKE